MTAPRVSDPARRGAPNDPDPLADPADLRAGRILVGVVLAAIAAFALLGIGSPLLGQSVFAATDELVTNSPYREMPQFADVRVTNNYVDDTWDSAIPSTMLFADQLRRGEVAAWNPYSAGGVPLGATPNYALASPLTVPFLLLPAWLAPALVKLLEILVAVGATYLFLRRLGLRRPSALLGGLAFASSAFMVVWTNWPQTRVAAFIPAVFWAVELLVQRRRARDAAVLALAVAAMLLGGFPAVTAYTLLTAGLYLLARLWGSYRHDWRQSLAVVVRAGAGVAVAVLICAVQLVPWAVFMRSAYVSGRGQTPEDHLPVASLVTSVAPWALGSTEPARPPYWYLPTNLVESMSYVGAAVLVLAVTAVALARRGRAVVPPGAWALLAGAAAGWLVLIYAGGLPLAVAQQVPVLFADNFVGRARSVLGFLVAVLAAIGFEVLLRRPATDRAAGGADRRRTIAWAALVYVGLGALGLWSLRQARVAAYGGGVQRVDHLWREMAIGAGWLAVAVVCAVLLWRLANRADRRARTVRLVAAAVLPVLVAGQALTLVGPYWPRVDRSTFYPTSDVHAFLGERLGPDRFASAGSMRMSYDVPHRLRSATAHAFVDRRYGELVRSVPGAAKLYPTYVQFSAARETLTSPALDRMAVRYAVVPANQPVVGPVRGPSGATGEAAGRSAPGTAVPATRLAPGVPVVRSVPGTGGIRGIQLTPTRSQRWRPDDRISVVITGAGGRAVARSDRRIDRTTAGAALTVAVAAEDVRPGERLRAAVTLSADRPMDVRAVAGGVAVGAIGKADDGLKLVYAGSAVVYERLSALSRVRWAASAVAEPDPARRVSRLAGGGAAADQVVLDDLPPPGIGGGTATVRSLRESTDGVEVAVTAAGTGYLVLADAIQTGWTVTVDGRPADLLPADHAFAAVAVPDGTHTVRFAYASPAGGIGGWLTLVGLLVVAAAFALGIGRDRRRRRATGVG